MTGNLRLYTTNKGKKKKKQIKKIKDIAAMDHYCIEN
jgi:hypothetical protein